MGCDLKVCEVIKVRSEPLSSVRNVDIFDSTSFEIILVRHNIEISGILIQIQLFISIFLLFGKN